MTDAAGFQKGLDDFVEAIKGKALELQRRAVAEVHSAVVLATPVDTGHARQGWKIEVGGAGGVGVAGGIEQVANIQFGDRVRIVNEVPYVEYLNKGSSKQAAAGFAERAVAQVAAKLGGAA